MKQCRARADNQTRDVLGNNEKMEGFAVTGEDKQQKIQSLAMKESCERGRLVGERRVWEEEARRQTD